MRGYIFHSPHRSGNSLTPDGVQMFLDNRILTSEQQSLLKEPTRRIRHDLPGSERTLSASEKPDSYRLATTAGEVRLPTSYSLSVTDSVPELITTVADNRVRGSLCGKASADSFRRF